MLASCGKGNDGRRMMYEQVGHLYIDESTRFRPPLVHRGVKSTYSLTFGFGSALGFLAFGGSGASSL